MPVNEQLAQKMNIDKDTQFAIEILQERLWLYCKRPELFFSSPLETAKIIESYEFVLQTLWGFEPNCNYHSYWFNIRNCTCPELDNDDRIGISEKIISGDCIFHGIKLEYWPE